MFLTQILIPIIIGMITGMLSGWLSGAMVTHQYRRLDKKQEEHLHQIKYMEDSAVHLSRILNEIDLLIHKEKPVDYENVLREIGIIQIPEGKLKETHPSARIIREKEALLMQIEKELKSGSSDLRNTALHLIRISIRLMDAIDAYRRSHLT